MIMKPKAEDSEFLISRFASGTVPLLPFELELEFCAGTLTSLLGCS